MRAKYGRAESASEKLRRLGAALVLMLAATTAQAQFPGDVPDNFRLRVGGMYAWFTTEVTFQENITEGGPIGGGVSMEDILGVPASSGGFVARGYWNFLGRFFVDFGYTGFSRSQEAGIAQDFTFGDVTYTAGASVGASMKSHLPYVDFRYGIIKNDAVQFGVTLGAAYPNLEANATASAGVVGPGGPIVGQTVSRTAEISVPVPLLGLQLEGRLGDGFSGGILFNGIFAPVHPYVGSIFDAEAHVDWFATRNFGVGAAFSYTRFKIKREETNTYVEFKYSYYGPRLYALVTF